MELVHQVSELFPDEDHIHIHIYDGAWPHLNIVVPEPYEERFTLRYAAAVQSIFI